MLISKTPYRVSFCGGGSDFPEFYRDYPGCVVSTTIDKYVYLSMHPLFNNPGYHLKYFNNENVSSIEKIRHPIIKEVFKKYQISGVDFNSSSDVPSGTGLGSSSSFTVGLLNLCRKYRGYEPGELASEACRIEIDYLLSPIGKQDQYAAAAGGMNYIQFNSDDSVTVEKIAISQDKLRELEDSLILFYLGGSRDCKSILAEQKNNIKKNTKILRKLVSLTMDLRDELNNDSIVNFGEILNTGWQYKKQLSSNISNGNVNLWYQKALEYGAKGGKLLGGGATGFMLLYAPGAKSILRANMRLLDLPFKFENSGSTIMQI